jgi:hypothetical protein
MRHWSGAYWDVTQRRVPPWIAGTAAVVTTSARSGQDSGQPRLDGPAHPAMLPASVRSATRAGAVRRVPSSRTTTGSEGISTRASRSPAASRPGLPAKKRRWPPRASLVVSGTLVLAILLGVAGMVAISRNPVSATQVSADPVFIRSANSACSQAMGRIRITAGGQRGEAAISTPAVTARANLALGVLITKLQSLRSAAALGAQLRALFNDWDRFARDRVAEAATAPATKVLSAATERAAHEADSFALGNALGECVLSGS